ncbi:VOC family protein [Sporosarcina sp. FA15]|uniref:VOC family protein n=1 Tax=Sporosarcina sp. FA15 TaxID=3413031 RepID=UPI003F6608F1
MEIKTVVLFTKDLVQMKNFYINILGFSLLNEDKNSFRIAIGTSELEFSTKVVEGNPYYHFAFNIPANKFFEAKLWTKERVSLLVEEGKDEVEFVHLPAHALYFYDPAGNIVEFISRQSVSKDSKEAFSIKSILNISEISMTVDDAISVGEKLSVIGVTERDNNAISTNMLNFLGDRKNGVFILLTQPGRKWLFSDKKAAIYPLEITLTDNNKIVIKPDNEVQTFPVKHEKTSIELK